MGSNIDVQYRYQISLQVPPKRKQVKQKQPCAQLDSSYIKDNLQLGYRNSNLGEL
jgi:hypothetical protein